MTRSILILAGIGVLLVIAYFAYDILKPMVNPCESIFQQTRLSLATNLEAVRTKGEVIIGQEKLQELSERSQITALNLKTCCIVLSGGELNSDQFLRCKDDATQYQNQIEKLATDVSAARTAQDRGDAQAVKETVAQIDETLAATKATSAKLQERVEVSRPPQSSTDPAPEAAGVTETEPNSSILEANPIPIGGTVSATIADESDSDYFVVKNQTKFRDIAAVVLTNRSTTLRPRVTVYNDNKSQIADLYDSTSGANVSGSFVAEAQRSYYVQVSQLGTGGAYELSVKLSRAYDSNEPNDSVADATPIKVGVSMSASALDSKDLDWYKVTGFAGNRMVIRLENQSDWMPKVVLRDHNKHVVGETYTSDRGANVELSASTQPGDYFVTVQVFSGDGGPYSLLITAPE